MIVRCIEQYPTPAQLEVLGAEFYRKQGFGVTQGKEYLVLGLSFTIKASMLGTGAALMVEDDDGHPTDAPLCLFEIVDPQVSSYWEARATENGWLTLWPPSFYRDHYHEDLFDGEPELEEDFKRVVHALREEAQRVRNLQ